MKKYYITPSIFSVEMKSDELMQSLSVNEGSATDPALSKQRNTSTYSHEDLGWDY